MTVYEAGRILTTHAMATALTDVQKREGDTTAECAADGVPVLLTIGSNAVDAERRVVQACDYLRGLIRGIRFSEAVMAPSYTGIGADYINIAATGRCEASCDILHEILRRYEDTHGRQRPPHDGCIAIDIDVIVYGADVVKPEDMARTWVTRALAQLRTCDGVC